MSRVGGGLNVNTRRLYVRNNNNELLYGDSEPRETNPELIKVAEQVHSKSTIKKSLIMQTTYNILERKTK